MKLLLEIKTDQKPSADDIIVWDGNEWAVVSKDMYLASTNKKIKALAKRIDEAEKRLDKKDEQINILAKAIGGK